MQYQQKKLESKIRSIVIGSGITHLENLILLVEIYKDIGCKEIIRLPLE